MPGVQKPIQRTGKKNMSDKAYRKEAIEKAEQECLKDNETSARRKECEASRRAQFP
jgi:hypothetical protein